MNEEAFVDFLGKRFPFPRGVGIGDDASVFRCGSSHELITTDLLVEDVHFRIGDMPLDRLAEKALAVNLSDIAAMGGTPDHFYLGLGFPERLPDSGLRKFFRGLERGCRRWKVALAGGDFSRSAKLTISITVVGWSQKPVLRRTARPGDWIGITGPVGESALGLKLLLAGKRRGRFVLRHQKVEPELAKGAMLAPHVHAMIDVSDGLVKDLKRLLAASRVGAVVDAEKIPISPGMRSVCRRNGWDPLHLALAGGEDYVLLFTASPAAERRLQKLRIGHHPIGRIRQGRRLMIRNRGKLVRLASDGYDHFIQANDQAGKEGRP